MGSEEQEFADQFYIDEDTKEKKCMTHNVNLYGVVCPQCKALRVAEKN